MIGRTVVVNVQTGCILLHSVCDLNASQTKVQRSLIREFYEFEQGHNVGEVTKKKKKIVVRKVKTKLTTVQKPDSSRNSIWVARTSTRSGRPKTLDSIDVNPVAHHLTVQCDSSFS